MVEPLRRALLASACSCLLVMTLVALAWAPKDVTLDHKFKVARARATLVALGCSDYETDNGRFPITEAELHWPLDYVKGFTKLRGFEFDKANQDPLSNGSEFLIRPVLKKRGGKVPGFSFRSGEVDWWVISSAQRGGSLRQFDVLYLEELPFAQSFLKPILPHPSEKVLWYISDDEIRELSTSPSFNLKRIISEAELE